MGEIIPKPSQNPFSVGLSVRVEKTPGGQGALRPLFPSFQDSGMLPGGTREKILVLS